MHKMEITAYLPHQVILIRKSVVLVRTTKFLQMENQSNWKIVHFINTSHIQRGGMVRLQNTMILWRMDYRRHLETESETKCWNNSQFVLRYIVESEGRDMYGYKYFKSY